MKKLIILITLKIVEIITVVFVPYWLGLFYIKIWEKGYPFIEKTFCGIWFHGLAVTFVTSAGSVLILALILKIFIEWYDLNKDWTDRIHRKWFE